MPSEKLSDLHLDSESIKEWLCGAATLTAAQQQHLSTCGDCRGQERLIRALREVARRSRHEPHAAQVDDEALLQFFQGEATPEGRAATWMALSSCRICRERATLILEELAEWGLPTRESLPPYYDALATTGEPVEDPQEEVTPPHPVAAAAALPRREAPPSVKRPWLRRAGALLCAGLAVLLWVRRGPDASSERSTLKAEAAAPGDEGAAIEQPDALAMPQVFSVARSDGGSTHTSMHPPASMRVPQKAIPQAAPQKKVRKAAAIPSPEVQPAPPPPRPAQSPAQASTPALLAARGLPTAAPSDAMPDQAGIPSQGRPKGEQVGGLLAEHGSVERSPLLELRIFKCGPGDLPEACVKRLNPLEREGTHTLRLVFEVSCQGGGHWTLVQVGPGANPAQILGNGPCDGAVELPSGATWRALNGSGTYHWVLLRHDSMYSHDQGAQREGAAHDHLRHKELPVGFHFGQSLSADLYDEHEG